MVRAKGGLVSRKGLNKGTWTREEDDKLRTYIQRYGHWNWRQLPKFAGLTRCGKSCRLRWMNYLRPGVKRGNFTKEEDDLILALHEHYGNRWCKIAAKLPGRTDNDIKNHWHTRLKKLRKDQQVDLDDKKNQPIENTRPDITMSQTMSETEPAGDSSLVENNGPKSRQATSTDTFSCASQEANCDDLAFSSCLVSDHDSMSGFHLVAEDYTFMGSSIDGGSDNLDFWTRPIEVDYNQDDGYDLFSYAAFDDSLDLFFQMMPDPSENM